MRAIGICIGASTIVRVDVENQKDVITVTGINSKTHEGNIKTTLETTINETDLRMVDKIAITGRKFKNFVKLSKISEPEAIEEAYGFLKDKYGEADYISCVGGETFSTYQIGSDDKIINIFTGNKCASGTGEFFLQQIKRMGIPLEEAIETGDVERPYKVSGRCTVFCKSDCTHALNKGEKKDNIIVGLCEMMSQRILEHIGENSTKKVWLTGGCVRNKVMVRCLKNQIPSIVIPWEATYFEALGAALWALKNQTVKINEINDIFLDEIKSFATLPDLSSAVSKVIFKDIIKSKANAGDNCILGLDVGSTTTKAVIIRESDYAILASVYLKTLGDPVKASKNCYTVLKQEINCNVNIIGLGVTGSGRQIAGLHALTDCVYNEISAHAAASIYFDPDVDTIFEIGGQDAKYTHIINRVPCDYAMNEACSAGTGSFLEESASEYLNINVRQIEEIAMRGIYPPDFNDQCAAFIGSDIKTAMQENINIEDIVAGLIYSICKNYLNRVKGNRYVGNKIFMQGGVCYNKAVPVAMASLLDRNIIVPPEPGLMGAFGVALMVDEKIRSGVVEKKEFNLDALINRDAVYDRPFICKGGNIKCDRKCSISLIDIDGKKYPFGGICGKYTSIKTDHQDINTDGNLIKLREEMVFDEFSFGLNPNKKSDKKMGINRSLLVHSLFPLYYNFFNQLGLEVILPERMTPTETAVTKKDAAFCHPVSLAHDYFKELLKTDADYLFLPHVKGMPVENSIPISLVCPLAQGETYVLRSSFNIDDSKKIFSPVLDIAEGYDNASEKFVEIGRELGFTTKQALEAFNYAVGVQNCFVEKCKDIGKNFLEHIKNTNQKAIVLFGRPYNAYSSDSNMGIPEKFVSRGFKVIPCDFMPIENEPPQQKMYWSQGQIILKAANFVERHPQLFGAFITNFSCGPDSFVVGYVRDIMGNKPSLTLELDSHTADAGIDTRIDAFIDVMNNYKPQENSEMQAKSDALQCACYDYRTKKIKTISGENVSLSDPKVKILIPSMGHVGSRGMAAAFKYVGINAVALDAPDDSELQTGRSNSSCKECLPLALTVGSLLNYLKKNKNDQILVYFMPEAPDPCRFGQYHVYTEKLLMKMGVTNVALLTLSSGNSYGGMQVKFKLRAWQATVISDVLEDIRSTVLALSKDKDKAIDVFNEQVDRIILGIEKNNWNNLKRVLKEAALVLSKIPLKENPRNAKKVALVGEIYVRRDDFSRQYIVEKLASKGILTKVAPVAEWIYYCDYLVNNDLSESAGIGDKIYLRAESAVRRELEKEIKKILSKSGLVDYYLIDVDKIIANAKALISPYLSGEAILTIGTAITEIIDEVDGVISIGPFSCMPSRLSEAILSKKISVHKKETSSQMLIKKILEQYPNLPFLSIETDGNIFPQMVEIKLEAFSLQVERLNRLMNAEVKLK